MNVNDCNLSPPKAFFQKCYIFDIWLDSDDSTAIADPARKSFGEETNVGANVNDPSLRSNESGERAISRNLHDILINVITKYKNPRSYRRLQEMTNDRRTV
jgi:hypothetical protein